MLKLVTIFAFGVLASCNAETSTGVPQVYCGEPPSNMFICLKSPNVLKSLNVGSCPRLESSCEKLSCSYRNLGWLDESGKINKPKIRKSFDDYAASNPTWSQAVNYLKMYCLSERDLPPQGIHLNCPAYDITHCIEYSFIKNAQQSNFLDSKECDYARSYAANCPVCPSECFSLQVPIGSCNACLTLPRSP